MADEEQLHQLEEKMDRIIAALPAIEAFASLLVEADAVTKRRGLNPKTISANNRIEKFQEPGRRKLLIRVDEINVIKQRKRSRARTNK